MEVQVEILDHAIHDGILFACLQSDLAFLRAGIATALGLEEDLLTAFNAATDEERIKFLADQVRQMRDASQQGAEAREEWAAMKLVAAEYAAYRLRVAAVLERLRAEADATLDAGQSDFISSPADMVRRHLIARLDAAMVEIGGQATEQIGSK